MVSLRKIYCITNDVTIFHTSYLVKFKSNTLTFYFSLNKWKNHIQRYIHQIETFLVTGRRVINCLWFSIFIAYFHINHQSTIIPTYYFLVKDCIAFFLNILLMSITKDSHMILARWCEDYYWSSLLEETFYKQIKEYHHGIRNKDDIVHIVGSL